VLLRPGVFRISSVPVAADLVEAVVAGLAAVVDEGRYRV
jgi:hypothetical protein